MNPHNVCALHRKNRYDLILLDLQMPYVNGFEIMKSLREIEMEGYLPVIVITAYPKERLHALKAGANDFISKPIEIAEVLARVHNMLEVRLLHRKLHHHNDMLAQQVRERTLDLQLRAIDLQEGYLETIFTMTRAAELKDEDTGTHVQRISYYSRELARILGMDETFIDTIFFASPMHDIGKIGIPDCILLKPCGFTPDEWLIMQEHSAMGARILGDSKSPYLKMGAEIALTF
jgi:putative two-component system response regulator